MHHRSGKVLLGAFILFSTLLSGTAGAQTKTLEEIVAWVNNDIILKSEYERRKAQLREELAQPAPRGQVLQREVYPRVTITMEEARKYYDSHVKDFDRPAGIRVREITIITENRSPEQVANQRKKAEEALAAIKKGDDFGQVADKYSESET